MSIEYFEFWFLQQKEIIEKKRKELGELESVAKSLKREIGEMNEKLSC